MSEINNNNININSNNLNVKKYKTPAKSGESLSTDENKIKDLGNNPSNYIGRSQVKKFSRTSFKGKMYESISADLEVMQKNPELVEKSDALFENALNTSDASIKDPYAHAVNLQSCFVNEFKK